MDEVQNETESKRDEMVGSPSSHRHTACDKPTHQSSESESFQYTQFLANIEYRFKRHYANKRRMFYVTPNLNGLNEYVKEEGFADGVDSPVLTLFDAYLAGFPKERRQHYRCSACRHFVNQYGNLATIDDDGNILPVFWERPNEDPTSDYPITSFFEKSNIALYSAIAKGVISGEFFWSEKTINLGERHSQDNTNPCTASFVHMCAYGNLASTGSFYAPSNRLDTPSQASAEIKDDIEVLKSAVGKFSDVTISRVLASLRAKPGLDKFVVMTEWFLSFSRLVREIKNPLKANALYWKFAADAPTGWASFKNTVVGSLAEEIENGSDGDEAFTRFIDKLDPMQYQRPQAAPSDGAVERAEKIFESLGLASSLRRRFAGYNDIPAQAYFWAPKVATNSASSSKKEGIFASVKTKEDLKESETEEYPVVTGGKITFTKLRKLLLTLKVSDIQVFVKPRPVDYVGLTAATDPDSKPILNWDTEEVRNTASVYLYHEQSFGEQWHLSSGSWVKSNGIIRLPHLWNIDNFDMLVESPFGNGCIFLLDGMHDDGYKNVGSLALFPGFLKKELYEVRSVVEAYSKAGVLDEITDPTACGLLLPANEVADANTVRIRIMDSNNMITEYTVDRWE